MKKIAIIFGGVSFEHEISIVSAITIKKVLESKFNDIKFIFLDKNRDFYHISAENMKASHFSKGDYKKGSLLNIKHGGFYSKGMLKETLLDTEIYINLIHGKDGEDAKMASILEFFNLDYIGPRIEASVISFNKKLTKLYSKELGVETLPYEVVTKSKKDFSMELPVIIKPATLGSSIGIVVVKSEEEKAYAIDTALEYDKEAIVEPFISGIKEFNIAGTKIGNEFKISIIEEPDKKELLDFDKKYLDFARSGDIKEADIDKNIKNELIEKFEKLYNTTFEGSIPRFDFFVYDGKVMLNEINPIPGSLANYLFNDFADTINELSGNLPKNKNVDITYNYISKINKSKG